MTQPTTIRTQRPIEICIKRFQSLTPGRLFRPDSDELIIQASEIVKRNPDETRFNLAVIFHRTGWRKIPIYANLEANGFVNSDYAGTLIHYQIKNTPPSERVEKIFLFGWRALTLILPLIFLIKTIQAPGWNTLGELGVILLLPVVYEILLRSTRKKGSKALHALLNATFSMNGAARLDESGNRPTWLNNLHGK